jgi:hypothetical protein
LFFSVGECRTYFLESEEEFYCHTLSCSTLFRFDIYFV